MLRKFKGCLLGMAIGDSLGAPVEFLSLAEIKEKYGEEGITEFDVWDGFQPGSFTDDTQLSIATAMGCIQAHYNLLREGESRSLEFVYKRYSAWLESMKDPFQARRPGYTCMTVLQSGQKGTIGEPVNDSTEVSGLLRTAPAGLAFPPGMAFREGADYAALTHGNPSAYFAAGFFAEMIAQILEGKSLQDAVELSIEVLTGFDQHTELLKHLETALEAFIDQSPAEESIGRIGDGVTAPQVLSLGLFCSLKYASDFPKGVKAAVNHGGASTSCGLVTGAILGTLLGQEGIPDAFNTQIENAHLITEIAEDMYKVFRQGERISFEKYSLE